MSKKGLLLWIGAAVFLAACGKSEPALAPRTAPLAETPLRILAFGDSLTAGKDLEDPDREAYPAVLERLLKEAGHSVTVTNAGHSGDTTFDALARLDFSLAEKPRIVIVGLGSNDTFQGKRLADMEKNLDETVRRCREAGAVVVLCGMKTFPNFGLFYASDYAKMFKRVAHRQRAILVPFMLEGVAGDPAMNLPDMIHPNPRGQERVAQNLLPYVEKALKKTKE
ncbi:MAG: arylesterase [Elusimicrobia bacterium]|nr:arylesterase [Elusimicrobiota bacterium]